MMFLRRRKKDEKADKVNLEAFQHKIDKKKDVTGFDLNGSRIILRPLVTEKAAYLASQGKYVFEVVKNAGSVEVKNAIALMYGVRPTKVNIQNYRGDKVSFGKNTGRQKYWKKAIVTLAKGSKIDVYESK